MKQIDINKKKSVCIDSVLYMACVDTETIGTLDFPKPFEIGIKIINVLTKEIVFQMSYLVRRYFNNKDVMSCSFSANKYPKYLEMAQDKKSYFIGSVRDIMKRVNKALERFNVSIMMAHNGMFDKMAINNLCNEFGVINPFDRLDLLDTMEISKIITYSKDYVDFCKNNENIKLANKESAFITNSGRVRLTAQAIYSYLINNPKYQEEHTALADIDIEIAILYASLERLGNRQVFLNTAPKWREYMH
jgi:hypothetical protein